MKVPDRNALREWETYRHSLLASTTIDTSETTIQQKARIKRLEADDEAWFAYYFEKYCTAEPADFHKRATMRIMNNERWYETRAWCRELAKSTRAMMEVLKLALTAKTNNVLLASHSYDNACELLMPFKINLEVNQRIINDYGKQENPGRWEAGKFVTRLGVSFRALGAGQSPRGTRNEEARPDLILIDDIDTDEEVRNQERIKQKWNWIEQALIPTMSVSGRRRILFLGNIIGKDTCIVRSSQVADHLSIVNIRDQYGKSTWPSKNSEEHIDYTLSKISYASGQKEYFNNPVEEGTVFKSLNFKILPSLKKYRFVIAYGDPSFKQSKKNDFKAVVLVGQFGQEFHVIKGFCEQTSTKVMAGWYKTIKDYVGSETPVYYYMEANGTQDIILDQVNAEIFANNWGFSITADKREKGDKFSRIESLLEPLNNNGHLWFNKFDELNEHMKRGCDQFKALEPSLMAHDDFPDAVHGGISLLREKTAVMMPPALGKRPTNKKRY
jgi:hypothetical protein